MQDIVERLRQLLAPFGWTVEAAPYPGGTALRMILWVQSEGSVLKGQVLGFQHVVDNRTLRFHRSPVETLPDRIARDCLLRSLDAIGKAVAEKELADKPVVVGPKS